MKDSAILSLLWNKHTSILLHYLKHLPDPSSRTVFLLYDIAPEIIQAIKQLGAHVVLIKAAMLPRAVHLELKATVQRRLLLLRQALSTPVWQTYCTRLGVSSDETADTVFELAAAKLETAAVMLKILNKIHLTYDIELIITSEDVTFDTRVAILWGRQQHVPSLHFQHGPVLGLPFSVHWGLYADHMAVYGVQAKNAFAHVAPQRIHVVGHPAWEDYRQRSVDKSTIRQQMMQTHQLPPDLPVVLFGTTAALTTLSMGYDSNGHEKTLQAICQAKKALSERCPFSLVIKERLSNIRVEQINHTCQRIAAACGLSVNDYVYVTDNVEQWLTAADVVVASESSLGIEAMHTNTPSISLSTQFGMIRGAAHHVEDGILEVCDYNPTMLSYYLARLLQNPDFRDRQVAKMQAHVCRYSETAHNGNAVAYAAAVMQQLKVKR